MVFVPHVRVTAIGTLGLPTPVEDFNFGFALGNPDGSSRIDDSHFDDVAASIDALFQRAATKIWSGAVLTEVKFARIGADGLYVADPYIVTTATPGSEQSLVPAGGFQLSLACSLTTATRGAKGRGRFYLPQPYIATQGDGLILDVDRDGVANSVAQMITDINDQVGVDSTDDTVIVASSAGVNSRVTGVRVGRVLDTIRSRRRQLDESYDPPVAVA